MRCGGRTEIVTWSDHEGKKIVEDECEMQNDMVERVSVEKKEEQVLLRNNPTLPLGKMGVRNEVGLFQEVDLTQLSD